MAILSVPTELAPTLEESVELEYNRLDLEEMIAEIETESASLESLQSSEYESRFNLLQRKATQYEVNYAAYERQLEAYNKKINAYNSYLDLNCRAKSN